MDWFFKVKKYLEKRATDSLLSLLYVSKRFCQVLEEAFWVPSSLWFNAIQNRVIDRWALSAFSRADGAKWRGRNKMAYTWKHFSFEHQRTPAWVHSWPGCTLASGSEDTGTFCKSYRSQKSEYIKMTNRIFESNITVKGQWKKMRI